MVAIATRTLLVAPSMSTAQIIVWPVVEESDGTWTCKVEMVGLSVARDIEGYGEDGIQAIKLAIQAAEAWIRTLLEYKENRLLHTDGSVYQL
jgi:hypothetical protein